MSLSLGTLEIGLGLNTAQYDSGIKSAKDKLSSLERRVDEISSTVMKIKVGVDDSQLYKLNDHLNIKTSHLEEVVNFYKANPIKVFVDDESLDILNQKLDNLSKQDINLSSSSGEQIGQQLFDGIEKALSDLGNVVSAPLKSVFTGVFEGIGNEISKNFTRNAINSFTSSMRIPSLGDLGNISGEEIGVSFGGKRKSTKKSTKKKNNRQDGDFLETLIDTGFDIAVDAIPVNNSKLKKLIKTVLQREIDNAVSSARNETAKVSSNNNVVSSVNKASQDIVTAVKRVEDAVRGGDNALLDPWSDTQIKDMWGGEPDIVKRQRKEIDRALHQKSLPPSPDRLNRISNTPSPSFFQEKVKDLAVTAKSRLEDVLVSRLGTPDKSGTIQHLSGNENFAELLQLTLVKELKTAGLLLSKAFQDTSLDVVKFGQVVYAVMQALERPVMALPGAAIGKKAIQVGGTAAMGAAAIHALPGGLDTAVVESMRTILSEALSAGGTQMLHAVQAQMTSVFNGLPFGIGQQLTTAVMQLVTELTNGTINVLASGGAIAGSSLAAGEGVKKLLGAATSNIPKLVSTEEQQRIEGKTQKALKAAKNKADSLITTEITPYFDERVFPVSNPIPANIKAINPEYYTVKQLRGLARDQGINVPASGVGSKKEEIWKSLTERFNPDQLTRILLTTKASDRTKLGKKELSGVQIPTTEIPADFTKRIGIGIKNIGQEINTTKDIQSLERLYFQLEKVKKGITALRANPEFNTTGINKSLSGFLQSVDNLQTQILTKSGLESGKDYQQGLKLGLSGDSAQKIAYQNALKIVDATDKGLGNASPSKKGKKSGEDYIKGVEIGAENQSKSLFRKVSDIGKKTEEIYAETIKESEQKALPPVNKLATEPSLKKSLTVQEYSRSLYGYLGQQVKKAEKSIEQKNAQKNLSSNEPVKVQINQPKETKPSNEPVKVKIVSSSDSGSGQPPKPPKPPTISSQPSPDDDNNKSSGQKVKVKAVSNISKEATQNTSEQVKNETKQTTRTFLEKIFGKPGDDFRRRREEVSRRREADPTSVSYWDEFFRKLINKAGSKIYPEGTASERRTVLGEVTSTGVAMATAFAPISTAQIATLFPLVLPAIPAIISSLGVFNMLSPAFQGGADRITQTETINSRLNALTGNPDLSGKEYEYLKELADKYRVSLQSLSEGYTQLAIAARGTKLEGDPVKDLFEGITASVKALRLNTADTSLVLNAYTQILSKGKVSMEELRQQLGEKFPPAMQVFSKALGLSTAEFNTLVSKGAILSEDILPKVGKILKSDFGFSALAFSNDFTSSLAALETAGFEFSRKFAETFSPAYAAITNLGANTLRIVSDNFRTVLELATALSIGVAAQIAVGLQQMLIVPAIATKLAPVQAAILSTWKTVLTGISPFMVGTFADILSYALGADQSIFQNITSGIKNAVESGIKAVDAAKVNLTGISFFDPSWSKIGIPDKEVQGLTGMLLKIPKAFGDAGSALVNFFKTIPSGVVELAALVLTFEQLSALYKLYLVPMGTGLKATFIELGKAIHQAFLSNNAFLGHLRALFPASGTLAERFVFMRQQILGFATTTSLASASLNVLKAASLAFIGVASKLALPLAFLSFANGDFTNQLMDDFRKFENNAISNIENIQKALDGLTAPKLKIEIDNPTEILSKGIELNPLKTLNLSDKSYKSDDLTKSINRDPALASFIKFVSNPISPDLANKKVKDAKKQANALGIGNYFSDNQEFLTQSQTDLLSTAQKYKQFGENLNNSSLGKVGLSDPRNVGKFIDTTRPVVNDLKIIDNTIQRLSKQRIALGLENTTNARNEIKKIDDQIGILLKKRKDTAKPLQEVMDFDSIRIGLQEQIKQIDESDYPEQAKRSLKALLQPTLDNLNKVKSEIDKAGISTILEPLESIWQSTIDRLSDAEKTFNKILNKIEIRTSGKQLDLYTKNLDPAAVQESQAKIDISKQKQTVAALQTILQERQSALSDLLSIPNVENNESRKQEIDDLREKVTDSEKELASARLSLAKSEYDATQDRLRKQQSETKLRVDSEIARKRIDVIRANPFGGVNASLKNAEIDVEERIQAIGLLYQQLADNTGNPIEIKSQIVAAELALEQARANLLQQQTSLQDYYRNLDRQIIDFNRQIEDYRRQIEDTQLSAFKENRSLSESYTDLVRELDKNLLNAQNQLLDTTDRIRVQQVKNRLLIPGTSDAGKELGDIFLEFVQGQADLASRGRTFQSRTEEIETSYISTLRNIRNLQEQQQDAERNRLKTIEDIKRTQENLNRTLADLIRQTNKELGFIPQSIKDIVTNLNTLPEPIKLINSELVAIPPNIKTSGEDLVKSIKETAEAIRKAKESLILPAPSNFIPAPVWNGGGILPPPPSQSSSIPKGLTPRGQELSQHLNNPRVKAFLDVIAYAEGTSNMPNKGYNTLFGHGQFSSFADHPRQRIPFGSTSSSASGRYQIMDFTWDEEKAKLGLKDFSPVSQDLVALSRILMRGGLDELLKGDIRGVINATRKEWASFPGANYPGQGMKRMEDLLKVYDQSLRKYQPNAPRTQSELDALRYDGNPANSGASNRIRQIRRNQGGQGVNVPSQSPVVPSAFAIPKQIQSVLVQEVGGKTVFSKNANTPPASPASTIKLIVADILSKEIKKGTIGLKDQITIKQPLVDPHGTLKSGNKRTVQELLDLMLRVSDNTATNVLIDLMGGLQSVTNKAQQSGYTATTLSRYLNIPGSGPANRSNAVDTTRAMQAILSDNSEAGQLAEKSIRQTRNFKFSGELGGKIGNNSKVIGNVGIVVINGKEYIVTAYANVDGNILSNRGIITNTTNIIKDTLERKGQGGPEFSSPPLIAQIPTLPNQNQDNFWDADLPPVPKDNPINFQSPNLPPVPNLPTGNLGAAADQNRNAEIANQNAEEFLRQLEASFLIDTTLDRAIKFGQQQEEDARALERTLRDASENVADLTINSKGYLTVQEEINKSATEVSRQYRSQIESLEDQRRTLLLNADGWQKMSENIKKVVAEQIALGKMPADVAEQFLKNADALAKRAESAKEQVTILDQAIEQLGKNQGVATLEASFRKTRDTVRSIRDRLNDLTIQRMRLEFQSGSGLFDNSAILAERISLQKEKEELEDYLEPYKDLPQYAEYVANIRSEWEKIAELRLERVALDASPNRGAAESFFSDIREGKGIGSAFSSLGLNIMTKFVEGITKPAIDALTSAIDGFTKPITQAFESVFNAIISPVGNFFTNALNSIFKPVGNIFSSIFGGGGRGGLFNGLLSGITGIFSGGLGGLGSIGSLGSIGASSFASAPASAFSLGTGFSLFSDGGKVGDANAPIEKNIISAFQRERAMSGGRKPRLIVANEDELILNPKETEAYLDYRNNAPIKNYANGGFVGGKPNYSTTSNTNSSNQSLVINNTNNVTVESRNDMGYSLNQLKERENAQNERTKKRFFG